MNIKSWRLKLWLAVKLLFNRKTFFSGSAPLALLGLVLGVAALIASQAVMRGFQVTLKKAMVDVTADIQIVKRGKLIENWNEFEALVKRQDSRIKELARFAYAEAVLARDGAVTGVLIQGMFPNEMSSILNLKDRLRQGRFPEVEHEIVLGIGLANKFKIKAGDTLFLAVPLSTALESDSFRRQSAEFKVVGVMDLGKNEWNERLILSHLVDLQKLIEIGDRYTGAFVKLENSDNAVEISEILNQGLGPRYSIMNWYDVNKNLLEAVELEKIVIFLVVFLIVVVAAFNTSSFLYVLIQKKFKDIAILKTIGLSEKNVRWVFLLQGLLIGTVGSFVGLLVRCTFILGLYGCAEIFPSVTRLGL